MKIALICPASLPATQFGGILFLCVDIAREAAKAGHNATIYTTDLDFANNASTFSKNLPRLEIYQGFKINRTHVWFAFKLFFVNPGMYFQLKNDKPDIIHTVGIRSFQSLVAALISKKCKIPLVISDQGGLTTHPDLHGGTIKMLSYKMQNMMIKFVIKQAAKISVANQYEKDIFLQFTDESKIAIIKNGVSLEELYSDSIDFKKKYSVSGRFILFVGVVMNVIASVALAESKPATVNSLHESAGEKSSLIVTTDYILGPEDVLEITVWRNVDLSKTVTVRPDGKICVAI
ncbi:MAG: hypothetical protein EB163_08450 [Nitrososphaeria archaeon]|nr:hypothetical protein [Nitrososphaeria archaeon]